MMDKAGCRDDHALERFWEAVARFFVAIDSVQGGWEHPDQPRAFDRLQDGHQRMADALDEVRAIWESGGLREELSNIIPPPTFTPQQWLTTVTQWVEDAWHDCRFVYVATPDDGTPESENLKTRVPETRERLWKAWQFFERSRTIASDPSTAADETKAVELSNQDQQCDVFVPTDLQKSILGALNGCALRKDALAEKCKVDPSRLYRKGGINELREIKKVAIAPGVGYYRPDAPPPDAIELKGPRPATN